MKLIRFGEPGKEKPGGRYCRKAFVSMHPGWVRTTTKNSLATAV